MKQRLSILIPCFNVEKYIRQCLDSIYRMSLSLDEFEVLCFDDMSTDNTPVILNEYVKKFKNLCVLHGCAKRGPGGGVIASSQSPRDNIYGLWMEMI